MGAELFVVDAFTDRPFGGNPAGVVLLDDACDDAWMQAVANELRYSETAFTPRAGGDGPRELRWFTPVAEVDLCGHATLATAHVLGGAQRFSTRSGELSCAAQPDGSVELDFPADPPSRVDVTDPALAAALGPVGIVDAARGVSDLLVEVKDGEQVRSFVPDDAAILALPARGLIVTAPGDRDGIDFVSRCFYPEVGIPEDPVTGSAHTTLACWWGAKLRRDALVGEQASARGGVIHVTVRGDRVGLRGRAVTILRGELLV